MLRSIFVQESLLDFGIDTGLDKLTVELVNKQLTSETKEKKTTPEPLQIEAIRELKKTYLSQDLSLLQMIFCQGAWGKKFVAFVTISIMITCGLTNAGFILLLFFGEESFKELIGDLSWKAWETLAGIACAVLGGLFSGWVQKNIYLDSLNNLETMWQEGLMKGISGNRVYLFGFAVVCAICSFLVNYGMAMLGIGVLISGGSPIIIPLALLFALANSLLVFYTALDAIKQGSTIPDCLRNSTIVGVVLTMLFTFTAAWGLVMTFYSGLAELIGKHFETTKGQWVFGFILVSALLTEAYYSFTKACHLAHMFIHAKFNGFLSTFSILINALIASTAGIDGGISFAGDLDSKNTEDPKHNTELKTLGGAAAAGWSMTCAADIPKAETAAQQKAETEEKQKLIIHQFTQFREKAAMKNNKHMDANHVWKFPSLTFA